jgi:hypothetical protein
MSRKSTRRGGVSATELMAQLEGDEDYQRTIREAEAEREVKVRELNHAEQPIVADLRAVGVQVDSVWDLVNTAVPYPAALPILMDHLERGGYPSRVMESLGRALAVKPAVAFWDRLKARYLQPRSRGEQEGAAVALAASATGAEFDDLVGLLSNEECGQSRIYFVRPILALGGAKGRELIETLRTDPVLGKEASALSSRRVDGGASR